MRVLQNASNKPVVGVAFSANGRTLYAGGDGGFQVWPLARKAESRVVACAAGKRLYAFEPDPAGQYLYLASQRGGFGAVILRGGGRRPLPDDEYEQHVVSLSARPGGTHVAVSRGGAGLNRVECWEIDAAGPFTPVWRLRGGKVTAQFDPVYIDHATGFHDAVRFSPDGRTLAVVMNPGTNANGPHKLTLRDADTGKLLGELGTLPVTVGFRMRFTPDGAQLIGWEERWAEVWDVAAGKPVARITPPGRAHFRDLAVHPSGRWFATVGSDGRARGWSLSDFTETTTTDLGAGKLHAVAFSPDGRRGAAGADGGKVVLWDVNG